MLHEQELLELAEAYRYLAELATDPALQREFTQRAEHYQMIAFLAEPGRPEAHCG